MAQVNEIEIFDRVSKSIEKMLQMTRQEEDCKSIVMNWDTDIFSDLGIDSVEVMDLLASLEREFKITLDPDKAGGRRKLRDLVDFVIEGLKGAGIQ